MKRIILYMKEGTPIVIEDSDDEMREKYVIKLSEILSNNNITVLHTSNDSLTIRPNTIAGIRVTDVVESPTPKSTGRTVKKTPVKSKKTIKKVSQDIITD